MVSWAGEGISCKEKTYNTENMGGKYSGGIIGQ